jgi:ERCC4-type nuclease
VRGRTLFNAGYKTADDLRKAQAKTLASLPFIGQKLAEKLRQQAAGLSPEDENEAPQKQKTLADYS